MSFDLFPAEFPDLLPEEFPLPYIPEPATVKAQVEKFWIYPAPGTTYSAGPRGPQAVAVLVQRLAGPDYDLFLVRGAVQICRDILQTQPQLTVSRGLAGDASDGEPVPTLWLAAPIILGVAMWLESLRDTVPLPSFQRNLLTLGGALLDGIGPWKWENSASHQIADDHLEADDLDTPSDGLQADDPNIQEDEIFLAQLSESQPLDWHSFCYT